MTVNKATKEAKYKILEDTGNTYDVGKVKIKEMPKLYNLTEHNLKIYAEVKRLQREIKKIEKKQMELIQNLKKGD